MPTPPAKDIPNYQKPPGIIQGPERPGLGGATYPKGTQGPSSPQTKIGSGQKGPYGGGKK